MKKLLLLGMLLISFNVNASYQLGTVSDIAVGHKGASVIIDTSKTKIDQRDDCLDKHKQINFVIDFSAPGGIKIYDLLMRAKQSGTQVGVVGTGECISDDIELIKVVTMH